jgi:hypothetical protein
VGNPLIVHLAVQSLRTSIDGDQMLIPISNDVDAMKTFDKESVCLSPHKALLR